MNFFKRQPKVKTLQEQVHHDLRFEGFIIIEGWAARGRLLAEKGDDKKLFEPLHRIHKALKELDVILKYDPEIDPRE